MPHWGQFRISTAAVVNLGLRGLRVCLNFIEPRSIHNHPGLIAADLVGDAGGTHAPPNLATNLKEKK
jgi:hypothetical protein